MDRRHGSRPARLASGLDEVQYTLHWQTWLKHQVDSEKRVRIVMTGSAVPLETESRESGVGRWHALRLATLFAEDLQIQEIELPRLPEVAPALLGRLPLPPPAVRRGGGKAAQPTNRTCGRGSAGRARS